MRKISMSRDARFTSRPMPGDRPRLHVVQLSVWQRILGWLS